MNVLKAIGGFVSKHESKILTGVSIGCEILAVYEAFKQAPKFKELAEELKEKKEAGEPVDGLEVVKKSAGPALKVGIPMAISFAAQLLNNKHTSDTIQSLTSLAMLYREGQVAMKDQIAEDHGQEEADRIEAEAAKRTIKTDVANGYCSDSNVYATGHGNVLMYDKLSERYFLSNPNHVEKVINELNNEVINRHDYNGVVEENEYYEELGLPRIPYDIHTKTRGWTYENGLISHRLVPMLDDNNQPYCMIVITNLPK